MPTRLVFSLVACLTMAAAPGYCTSFTDTFSSGASPLWGHETGNWIVQDEVYFSTINNNNPAVYSSLPFDLTDYTVEVDIANLRDGGVFIRSSDNTHGVAFILAHNSAYWHVVDGDWGAMLNSVSDVFSNGQSAHFRITAVGDTFSAYMDGSATPLTQLTTSLYSHGRPALYDFSDNTFDNVRVYDGSGAIPEPGTGLLVGLGLAGLAAWRRRRG